MLLIGFKIVYWVNTIESTDKHRIPHDNQQYYYNFILESARQVLNNYKTTDFC